MSFDKLRMTVGVFSVQELVLRAFSVLSYEVWVAFDKLRMTVGVFRN
jgi:hypothetical protein